MSDAASSRLDKDARIAELEAALAARDSLIAALRVQLARLRRMTFGQSSEKLSLQIEQLELALEELEGEAELADVRKPSVDRGDRPTPIRSLPAHLPREERRIEPAAGTCTCPRLRRGAAPIGRGQRRDARCAAGAMARHTHPASQV